MCDKTKFQDFLDRKHKEYNHFDASELASEFIPYFNSQERIKVKFSYGEILSGTISVTTGFKPCFLLMRTKRSIGSPHIISNQDHIYKGEKS
jgi:hypothetical protein